MTDRLQEIKQRIYQDIHTMELARASIDAAYLIERLERAEAVAEQGHIALAAGGHSVKCRIVGNGCDCGAAEDFKAARTQFYRQYNEYFRSIEGT